MSTKYKVGDKVQDITDPQRIGIVSQVDQYHADIQYYRVFWGGGEETTISELHLRLYVQNASIIDKIKAGEIDDYDAFQRLLTYQRLLKEHPLRNNIYAFNASRTRLMPHQFKPLIKFLESPKSRLLIADEVGLGKTIESGLILMELQARQSIRRVLVVCPSNLCLKWKNELKKRFDEDFIIFRTKEFLEYLDSYVINPTASKLKGIISLESVRRENILEKLKDIDPDIDLLIIDEAHHLRNRGRKQWEAGQYLSRNSDSILFLTATPLQMGQENLFTLLNLLDDEEFADFATMLERLNENCSIVRSQIVMGYIPPETDKAKTFLKSNINSPWFNKNPLYNEVIEKLDKLENKKENKTEFYHSVLDVQKDLASLNLLGDIFTRTRKRETFLKMPVRKAYPINVTMYDHEIEFYNAVTEYVISNYEDQKYLGPFIAFILHMPQRRMASCIPAMVEYYRSKTEFSQKDLPEDLDLIENENSTEINDEKTNLFQKLQKILWSWPKDGRDSKYEQMLLRLKRIRKENGYLKVIIFSFFKDTLNYLNKRLSDDDFNCVFIHGDVPANLRPGIIEKFESNENIEILLSSRVGSEGLDFQFCDTMFNYDLPWNPMEIEQRIGRLDRIGQKSSKIHIFNFYIKGTIEDRILLRLYDRIGIFKESIGEIEEIIGEELKNIEEEIFSKKLSPAEEEELLQQKLRNIEKNRQDLIHLEKNEAEFIGTDVYFQEEVDKIKTHRRYITSEQMRLFIFDFLSNHTPNTRFQYNPKTDIGFIKPDEKLRNILVSNGFTHEKLSTQENKIDITFSSEIAFENKNLEFIHLLHPLTRSITNFYKSSNQINSRVHKVSLKTDNLSPGTYFYYTFRLRVRAARSFNSLEMIILDDKFNLIANREQAEIILGEMVELGKNLQTYSYKIDIERAYSIVKELFHKRLEIIGQEIERSNNAFVNRRLESIKFHYDKQIAYRKESLEKAILNQRQEKYISGQKTMLNNKINERTLKIDEIESRRQISIDYDEISAGFLKTEN